MLRIEILALELLGIYLQVNSCVIPLHMEATLVFREALYFSVLRLWTRLSADLRKGEPWTDLKAMPGLFDGSLLNRCALPHISGILIDLQPAMHMPVIHKSVL